MSSLLKRRGGGRKEERKRGRLCVRQGFPSLGRRGGASRGALRDPILRAARVAVVGSARGTEQQEGGESELHVLQGSGKDTSCGYTGGSHPRGLPGGGDIIPTEGGTILCPGSTCSSGHEKCSHIPACLLSSNLTSSTTLLTPSTDLSPERQVAGLSTVPL